MKTVLVIAALMAVAAGAMEKSLRVRFEFDLTSFGVTSFIEVPQIISDVQYSSNWTKEDITDFVITGAETYCYTNYFICVHYENDTGIIAGVRISIKKSMVNVTVLDWVIQGYKEVTYSDDNTYWATDLRFVSLASQELSATERTAARDSDSTLCERKLWIEGTNGEVMEIPADYDTFIANTTFTKQSCIPFMGRHFYQKMSSTTQCTAEELLKHFLLMHSGVMVGVGTMIFPGFTVPSGQRDWCEHPTEDDVKLIVTSGPDCLYDLVGKYGVTTVHIYFIDTPRTSLTCIGQ